VGLAETQEIVFERGDAHALGAQVDVGALEAPVGVGKSVLQDAFEAGLSIAVVRTAPLGVFDAVLAAAQAVLEDDLGEGERGGDDGAATEGVPEEI